MLGAALCIALSSLLVRFAIDRVASRTTVSSAALTIERLRILAKDAAPPVTATADPVPKEGAKPRRVGSTRPHLR